MKKGNNKKVFAVILAISALIITIIAVHGCGVSSYEGKRVTSIAIDPVNNTAVAGTVTIAAHTVQQFTATGHYSDATTTDLSSATWSTSDSSVATVSATGLATAVASSGTCEITATGQGVTASVRLTVKDMTIQTIAVSPLTVSLQGGLTQQFTATGLFSDGTSTMSQVITALVSWSSSATAVATIDAQGLVTAGSAGTTDITAQWKGVTSSPAAVVTVSSGSPLQSITITANPGRPRVGATSQLTAMGTFGNDTLDITSQVTWSSADTTIATVDSTGLVMGMAAGRTTITATVGTITQTFQLTVLAAAGH
jgi:uncharacterized protein YjdB